MPESKINLSVGSMGKDRKKPRFVPPRKITYTDAKNAILSKNYGEQLTEDLLKKLGTYPDNTYRKFLTDIPLHIANIQKSKK